VKQWRRVTVLVVAATVACGLLGLGRGVWSEPGQGRPLRIGVVNLTRIWDAYEKQTYLNRKLTQLSKTKESALQEKVDQITQLRQKIQLLAPGSSQRDAAEQELQQVQVESRTLAQLSDQEVRRKYIAYWDVVYNDIQAAVTRLAEAEGYDLILKQVNMGERTANSQVLQGKISGLAVMYVKADLDLTDKVLVMLNDEFAKSPEAKEQAP